MTPISVTPRRGLTLLAITMLALNAVAGPVFAQDKAPSPADAQQPPPIQAKPGAPEGTPRTDQTVDVTKGTRLVLTDNAGEVVVRTWDRSAVRVQANHSAREQIDIQTAESALRVRAKALRGGTGLVDYRVTVPTWMAVNLSGTYLDADISGTAAEVTVETVGGNITVSGGSGVVSLRSVEGRIVVDKTTGRVQATGVNEGIRLSNTQGEVVVDTINGDVVVENAQTSNLEVSTVNGDLTFNGKVRDDGVYKLTTHGGDIRVGLGGAANAIIFVRTFQGDFSADFPIQLPDGQSASRGSKRFNFTLGNGRGRIELQSFNGDIHLAQNTVTSATEEKQRRRLARPPRAPEPPKPPKPPGRVDMAALDEMSERLAEQAERIGEQVGKNIEKMIDEEHFEQMFEHLEHLEHVAPVPPLPPDPPTPATPPTPPRPPRPPKP